MDPQSIYPRSFMDEKRKARGTKYEKIFFLYLVI